MHCVSCDPGGWLPERCRRVSLTGVKCIQWILSWSKKESARRIFTISCFQRNQFSSCWFDYSERRKMCRTNQTLRKDLSLAFPRFSLTQTLFHPTSYAQLSSVLFTCSSPIPLEWRWKAQGPGLAQNHSYLLLPWWPTAGVLRGCFCPRAGCPLLKFWGQ